MAGSICKRHSSERAVVLLFRFPVTSTTAFWQPVQPCTLTFQTSSANESATVCFLFSDVSASWASTVRKFLLRPATSSQRKVKGGRAGSSSSSGGGSGTVDSHQCPRSSGTSLLLAEDGQWRGASACRSMHGSRLRDRCSDNHRRTGTFVKLSCISACCLCEGTVSESGRSSGRTSGWGSARSGRRPPERLPRQHRRYPGFSWFFPSSWPWFQGKCRVRGAATNACKIPWRFPDPNPGFAR